VTHTGDIRTAPNETRLGLTRIDVGTREGTVKSRLHYGVAELRAAYDAASRDPERTLS